MPCALFAVRPTHLDLAHLRVPSARCGLARRGHGRIQTFHFGGRIERGGRGGIKDILQEGMRLERCEESLMPLQCFPTCNATVPLPPLQASITVVGIKTIAVLGMLRAGRSACSKIHVGRIFSPCPTCCCPSDPTCSPWTAEECHILVSNAGRGQRGRGRGTVRGALPQERGAETHQSENLLHGLHGVLLDLHVDEMLGCA